MRKPLFMLAVFLPLSAMAQVFNVQRVEQVPMPEGSEMVADISPDGTRLLLTTSTYHGLKSYDISSGQSAVLANADGAGYDARFASGGKAVVYREASYTPHHLRMTSLKSIDLQTGNTTELQAPTRNLQGVRLSGGNAMNGEQGKTLCQVAQRPQGAAAVGAEHQQPAIDADQGRQDHGILAQRKAIQLHLAVAVT